ncbi:glycosyltransferase involved in cell wall biogenesis [Nocardia mangyaensis]|uniref:Glycosyltransferase involved in cell wall biogenesis n=1 Tax=Nocardia mangyaensis TaxID=2213200 RepID=A0A1J0W1X4_9NOCA|nr:glycosyltransferase involved in cell wall biogenesis [Nocardia mangyaensis]
MVETTVLVVAKAPIAGFAKTRLTPPLRPTDAAKLAAAALLDTLAAVRASGARRAVVAWTGELADAQYSAEIERELVDFEVVPQRGRTFGERLANAHTDAAQFGLPVLQIGMDTPQITPELLAGAAGHLVSGRDAVLGPATDGGWWALGLTDPRAARLLTDVPMSTHRTGELTRETLAANGFDITLLSTLTDVDHVDDIATVAAVSSGLFGAVAADLMIASGTGP